MPNPTIVQSIPIYESYYGTFRLSRSAIAPIVVNDDAIDAWNYARRIGFRWEERPKRERMEIKCYRTNRLVTPKDVIYIKKDPGD
jgi:hypothetical protein